MLNFIFKSLIYYKKKNIYLLISTMITCAVITGALLVGDSVNYSLKKIISLKFGKANFVLSANDKMFNTSLIPRITKNYKDIISAPLLILKGSAANPLMGKKINKISVNGIDENFWSFAEEKPNKKLEEGYAYINSEFADSLNLKVNDDFVIRIDKPNALPKDAPFAEKDFSKSLRLKVKEILTEKNLSNFSLKTNHVTKPQIFMSLSQLQSLINMEDKANTILFSIIEIPSFKFNDFENSVKNSFLIEDSDLYIKDIPEKEVFELRSHQVFISDIIYERIKTYYQSSLFIFSYFVNSIKNFSAQTPYSIVSSNVLPQYNNLKDDEIVITSWLQEDLNVKIGDPLTIEYYVIDNMRKLQKKSETFKINNIIPQELSDPSLMPNFPGLYDAKDCSEWNPGIPIDLKKIRKKDELYWDEFKGAPKVFFNLEKAQKLFQNQFGKITSIRIPLKEKAKFILDFNKIFNYNEFGFVLQNIDNIAKKATDEGVDFSGLFIGLSFFIVAASLILTALCYIFNIESRMNDIGTMNALGFPHNKIKSIFLFEGALISFLGSLFGILSGIFYNKIIIYALNSIWKDAVQTSALKTYINISTLFSGLTLSFAIDMLAMFFCLKYFLHKQINELQRKNNSISLINEPNINFQKYLSFFLSTSFIVLLSYIIISKTENSFLLFFIFGVLILSNGLIILNIAFKNYLQNFRSIFFGILFLGIKNAARKSGKSIAIISILAIGLFIIISISANVKDSAKDYKRNDGTGGFYHFCETSIPISQDLSKKESLKEFGIDEETFQNVNFLPLRLKDGDDANCLNLNHAVNPAILGVKAKELIDKSAFIKNAPVWNLLELENEDDYIPAIADGNVIKWALKKSIGDFITYTNDNGEKIKLKFVYGLPSSIFQGYILISEKNFVKHFPSIGGYNIFLTDGSNYDIEKTKDELTKTFYNYGMEVTDTRVRLNAFNMVENTYLKIFLILGGLGLILSTLGFFIIISYNLIERKGELALLKALGFSSFVIFKIVSAEYLLLLFLGITLGTFSGIFTSIPSLISNGKDFSFMIFTFIISGILLTGTLSIMTASFFAVKDNSIDNLRKE